MQAYAKILGLVLVTLATQLTLPMAQRGLGDDLISRAVTVAGNTDSVVSRAITVTSNTDSIVSRAITVTSSTGDIVSRAITVTNNTNSIVSRAITVSSDCNGNGIADNCEISIDSTAPGGPFLCTANCDPDCNDNGIPDACDTDCNNNGIPDDCDIADCLPGDLSCADCNGNGIPDACDIANCAGDPACGDCNNNGIPDGCDIDPTDPDGNGQVSLDNNSNGIPDECINWIAVEENVLWSTGSNWDQGVAPGTGAPADIESPVIALPAANVRLMNVNPSVDSLVLGPTTTLDIDGGILTFDSPNGLRNDGSLTVADTFSIQASSPTSLRGSQPVQLAGPTAAISSMAGGDTITNLGTISGQGIIDADFVNDVAGSVIALSFGVLQIADPMTAMMPKINNGLFKATNGGTLRIDTPVSGSGSYVADHGTIEINADILGTPGTNVSFSVVGGVMRLINDLGNHITVDGCGPIIVRTGSASLFTVDNASLIHASSWTIGDALTGPDRATMELLNGSTGLVNGPVTVKQNGTLRIIDSSLTATDLILEPGANLEVASSLALSGSFTNDKTDGTVASWSWAAGSTLTMSGGQNASMDPESLTGWVGLEAASIDAGPIPPNDNFRLGVIALSGGAHVSLTDFANNGAAGMDQAVYCDSLTLGAGAVLNLNFIKLYVNNVEVVTGKSGGGTIENMSRLLPGDLNNDGQFDVGDMAGFIAVLIGQDTNPARTAAADLNNDTFTDGRDIQTFVDQILP